MAKTIDLLPGDRAAYRLQPKPFGRGGYALVYKAEVKVKATGEPVAFKKLRDKLEESRARLRREVQVQLALDGHPHVMRVVDAARDFSWYVMPLAAGDAVKLRDELDEEQALAAALLEVCDGLQAAHALGYVHRDVTPHNLFGFGKRAPRRWAVGDFGLVRQPIGQTTRKFSKTGVGLGTEGFIAPEIMSDAHRNASPKADVYSLGRIIGWAVTGKWPLGGSRDLPPGAFRQIVRRATATDPDARPTLDELAEMLRGVDFSPGPDMLERAADLGERAQRGDARAAGDLLDLALDNRDNPDVYLDAVAIIRGDALRELIRYRADDVGEIVSEMRRHLLDADWKGRHFDEANRPLIWLQEVASHAAATRDYGLLEDAAEALFETDAHWSRYDQRRRTQSWLQLLKGEAAATVARALLRVPAGAAWYTEEGWAPSRTTEAEIRRALAAPARASTSR